MTSPPIALRPQHKITLNNDSWLQAFCVSQSKKWLVQQIQFAASSNFTTQSNEVQVVDRAARLPPMSVTWYLLRHCQIRRLSACHPVIPQNSSDQFVNVTASHDTSVTQRQPSVMRWHHVNNLHVRQWRQRSDSSRWHGDRRRWCKLRVWQRRWHLTLTQAATDML